MPSPVRSSSGRMRSWLRPPGPRGEHDVPDVRVHLLEPLVRVLGPHRRPCGGVLIARARHRAAGQPELGRVVVGHQQQLVRAVGVPHVLGVVLDAATASARPTAGTEVGSRGVEHPHLAGVPVLRPDHHQLAAAGRVQHQLELLVRLLQHQLVGRGRRADPVPPDLVLPPHLVVDECRRSTPSRPTTHRRARTAARRPQVRPGGQVAEAQLVDLVAVEVHRVGHQRRVRGDAPEPQLHVVGVARQAR